MSYVVIGCPVRNRDWILSEYLTAISKLDYPKHKIYLYFVLNDSVDNSKKILEQFKEDNLKSYFNITIIEKNFGFPNDLGEQGLGRKNNGIDRGTYCAKALSECRNMLLNAAMNHDFDYLFFVDSDIIVLPDVLTKLIETKKDVVAALVRNDHHNAYNFLHIDKNISRGTIPSRLFQVDITGAVMLVSKKIFLNKVLRYYPTSTGEDEGFCNKLKQSNIPMYVLNEMQKHVFDRTKESRVT